MILTEKEIEIACINFVKSKLENEGHFIKDLQFACKILSTREYSGLNGEYISSKIIAEINYHV